MSENYAAQRIREALRQSGGDAVKAREQIVKWSYEDHRLLMDLAEPYLQGLVAYNMEQMGQQPEARPQKIRKTRSGKGTDFGLGILKAAVSSRAEVFGLETPQATGRAEKGASAEHIDAIRKLAKKSSNTPGE